MIVGSKSTRSILDTLKDSPFEFYPTGSRYFGNFRESSDYDFFAKDTDQLCSFLIDNKFVPLWGDKSRRTIGFCEYTDIITNEVYHYYGDIQIDIQLVSDVPMKIAAQEALKLKPSLLEAGANKKEHKRMWNFILKILIMGKQLK